MGVSVQWDGRYGNCADIIKCPQMVDSESSINIAVTVQVHVRMDGVILILRYTSCTVGLFKVQGSYKPLNSNSHKQSSLYVCQEWVLSWGNIEVQMV